MEQQTFNFLSKYEKWIVLYVAIGFVVNIYEGFYDKGINNNFDWFFFFVSCLGLLLIVIYYILFFTTDFRPQLQLNEEKMIFKNSLFSIKHEVLWEDVKSISYNLSKVIIEKNDQAILTIKRPFNQEKANEIRFAIDAFAAHKNIGTDVIL